MIQGLLRSRYRLILVLILSLLVGWLLADFQLPIWAFGVTLALAVHLAWAGTDAIFLSVVWLVIWLWVGVIQFSWPMSLKPEGWSNLVMISWVMDLGVTGLISASLIWSLALSQRSLIYEGFKRKIVSLTLVIVTWPSLEIGWIIQGSGLLPIPLFR